MQGLLAKLVGLAIAALLALPAAAGSEVLCIGEDGHLQLEDAIRVDCQERERARAPLRGAAAVPTGRFVELGEMGPEGADCGPCTDLSVESLLTAAVGGKLAADAAAPPPLLVAFPATPAPRPAVRRPLPERSLERPARRLYALGVLRC